MNEIISYFEMCRREQFNLQRGMNFRCNPRYSVLLMSTQKNSPYQDAITPDGKTLLYEGEDVKRSTLIVDPKILDQQEYTEAGSLTQNGKFRLAVKQYQEGKEPEPVRVYEKIKSGVWSYNGLFDLIDSWIEHDGKRNVFKFKLILRQQQTTKNTPENFQSEQSRIIPSQVKVEVWKRDQGRCVICGSATELHFDHIIPFSKGGSSVVAENIQLLCARHNLVKSNKII